MAKQAGIILLTGTINNLTFYRMNGQFYVRIKSRLRGDRVKTDPAFARTMVYADRLALASRTASQLYRSLPKETREVALYRKMTSMAMGLLKAGVPVSGVGRALKEAVFGKVQQQLQLCVTVKGRLQWGGVHKGGFEWGVERRYLCTEMKDKLEISSYP
jgi:hypothetical protein